VPCKTVRGLMIGIGARPEKRVTIIICKLNTSRLGHRLVRKEDLMRV
jgi:hypothetical protein